MEFIARNKIVLSLLFMVFFSISNLAIKSDIEFSLQGVIFVIVSPMQKAFHGTYTTIEKLWSGLTEINYLKSELEKTRQKLEVYEEVAQSLDEIKKENIRLRELLNYKERIHYDVIAAEIISKSPENFYQLLIINKGSSDGIKKYMPAVAYYKGEKAVVGKVIAVRWNVSQVLPVQDNLSKIGVILQKSRYHGLMSGNAPIDSYLYVNYISVNADFAIGEHILTSGEGGIFPPGLLIGSVIKINNFIHSGYKQAVVKPHIDFGNLDQLLIIKKDVNEQIQSLKRISAGEQSAIDGVYSPQEVEPVQTESLNLE